MATPGTPSGENHSADSQKCGIERRQPARVEIAAEFGQPFFEHAALDRDTELVDAKVEQALVRPLGPLVGRDRRLLAGALWVEHALSLLGRAGRAFLREMWYIPWRFSHNPQHASVEPDSRPPQESV